MSNQPISNEDILKIANEISMPHGLYAELLDDVLSVGVGGDERSYTLVVNLIGPFPGHDALDEISRTISSRTPINRVAFQLAAKRQEDLR